jgi:hypothetical protein
MIEFSEVDVTPELAEQWLAHSEVNRPSRRRKVAEFARDMTAGHWMPTAESVKFNTRERMIDGKHRCLAVIASGVTVRMVIARNVEDAAQRVMDSGSARTPADTLHIEGHASAATLAAVARRVVALQRGQNVKALMTGITKSEIYDFVASHPEVKDAIEIAVRYSKLLAPMPSSTIGVAAYLIAEVNGYDVADEFFNAAAEKVGLSAGDPVLAMCNCFAEYFRLRRAMPQQGQLSVIIRCFNTRVRGRPLRQVKVYSPVRGSGEKFSGGMVPIPRVMRVVSEVENEVEAEVDAEVEAVENEVEDGIEHVT